MSIIRLAREGSFLARPGVRAEDLEALLRAHRDVRDPARILKRNRGTVVTRVHFAGDDPGLGGEWVVKEVEVGLARRLLHLAGGKSRFAREAEKVERLSALGVDAPRPLAGSLRPRGGQEYLVTRVLEGGYPLRELLWMGPAALADPAERRTLLLLAGKWLRSLHERGIWQRDMKASNVIVSGDIAGARRFHLVDVSDVRFLARPLGERRRVRNLGQLLDLPARLDAEALLPLLEGYLDEGAADLDRWILLARAELEARRASRLARAGARYVDEER